MAISIKYLSRDPLPLQREAVADAEALRVRRLNSKFAGLLEGDQPTTTRTPLETPVIRAQVTSGTDGGISGPIVEDAASTAMRSRRHNPPRACFR